jgi:hypothetical protein
MEPYGTTIFCDDIRDELGGKLSLIGVYGPDLIIDAPFPALLPKLGILVNARIPIDRTISGLRLIIYAPGDADNVPSVDTELPWHPPNTAQELGDPPFPDAVVSHNFAGRLLLSPFVIKEEGYVRVRLICGDETIRVGALQIKKHNNNSDKESSLLSR